MIQKTFCAPKGRYTSVTLTPSRLGKSYSSKLRAVGMRYGEGEFLPAEKAEEVCKFSGEKLFLSHGALFGVLQDGTFCSLPGQVSYYGGSGAEGIAAYAPKGEEAVRYVFSETGLYRIGNTSLGLVSGMVGGKHAAVHHERLFLAQDSTLYYSDPMGAEGWDGTGYSGKIPLTPVGGKIVGLFSHGGELYVFRENAVFLLGADGSDLDFRFEPIEYGGGAILEGSVQDCGNYLVFATADALFRLSGKRAECVRSRSRFAFSSPMHICGGGAYYASVTDGEHDLLLVYEPERDLHRFLPVKVTALAGNSEGVYFGHGGSVYRLGGTGRLFPSSPCALEISFIPPHAENGRRLVAVTAAGEGHIAYTAGSGAERATGSLSAGIFTPLTRTLCGGEIFFRAEVEEGASVRSFTFHFREDV